MKRPGQWNSLISATCFIVVVGCLYAAAHLLLVRPAFQRLALSAVDMRLSFMVGLISCAAIAPALCRFCNKAASTFVTMMFGQVLSIGYFVVMKGIPAAWITSELLR